MKLAEIEKREGVRVVTVYVEEDEQTWKDKVITNELLGMINLNGHLSLGYISDNFNIGFVPKESRTYLLDQDKKILYKKISAEQVTQILDFEASKKTEE